jgi:hypothetical protein
VSKAKITHGPKTIPDPTANSVRRSEQVAGSEVRQAARLPGPDEAAGSFVTVALTEQNLTRPEADVTQADADLLISIREAAAEAEALLTERVALMRSFCEVSEKLAAARERHNSLRATAFSGHKIIRYDADGNPAGSTREDILDPGPVLTLEHLASSDYKVRALIHSFTRACNLRG